MGTEKEAANKVQEEANEAVHAWRSLVEDEYPTSIEEKMNASIRRHVRLADEIADVIQAACNLAVRYGIDLQAAMWRCERRNRERGRYEDEDAKPCGIRDGHDCNCGGSCGDTSLGVGVLRPKSPEEMSAGELIETLKATNSFDCRKILSDDWCDGYDTCINCRKYLFDMLKAAHEREIEKVRVDTTCNIARGEIAEMKRQIADLTHERDGLRRRLEELSEAGITSLHRLLRETLGEAKNITHNARVYINKQQGSNNERCGDCGTDSGCDSCDCGVERAEEHVLSAESPAREMNEREKVLERLRGYDVYVTEPPSKNANRLFACITGNKDARTACKDDVESVRDKLIELLSDGE